MDIVLYNGHTVRDPNLAAYHSTIHRAREPVEARPTTEREALSERTLVALSQLPAASDLEAQAIAPPALRLTFLEKENITDLAGAFQAALEQVTEAEADLSRATRLAAQFPSLQARQQRLATDAFLAGPGEPSAAAQDATHERDRAEAARDAVHGLKERLAHRRNAMHSARGRLSQAVYAARDALARRACEVYERAVVDILRSVAVHQALADTAGRLEDHSHHVMTVANRVILPALEHYAGIAPREFANGGWRHAGPEAAPQTFHTTAARGHLDADLGESLAGVVTSAGILR